MAQVLLPCFLPSWPSVKEKIAAIEKCDTVDEIVKFMREIHDTSNVGLDPEEDRPLSTENENLFEDFHSFLTNELSASEGHNFLAKTIKRIAALAGSLRELRPPNGLRFSLQQQSTSTDLNRLFVAALVANAFLSTFPKRNINTHPTLQNFNFAGGFFNNGLRDSPLQKAKLRSVLNYFDWTLDDLFADPALPPLRLSRKVMTGKQWLTIEDWNECIIPLSPVEIRHDSNLECSAVDVMQIIFVSPRVGGEVLSAGSDSTLNQYESVQFACAPELLVSLLFTEALEDNESLFVENCFQVSRILTKQRAIYERLETPRMLNFGCMDAEDYSSILVDQFEEDNFLRELNKCLLTFLPNMNEFTTVQDYMKNRRARRIPPEVAQTQTRRLSPIGERSTPKSQVFVQGASSSTRDSMDTDSELVIQERPSWLSVVPRNSGPGKFIVLGSSGECLPVNRLVRGRTGSLERFSSCETSSESSEEFHSAKESVDDPDEEEGFAEEYVNKLYSPEKRLDFAMRLRDALYEQSMESMRTDSTDDSFKRRGSDGFVLQEDSSFDEEVLQELILEATGKERAASRGDSSKYSFSTDMSSEMSDSLLNLSNEKDLSEIDVRRNKEVFQLATSILKRGLSESMVGCGDIESDNNIFLAGHSDFNNNNDQLDKKENHQSCYNNNSRSLSVELVKQKHRLAAKLISEILREPSRGEKIRSRRVATGNWGCGKQGGDVQLKFILQWMASSLAGVKMIYHTACNEKLSKLDTVCRILRDRKWSVGRLARCTLKSNQFFLENPAQFLIEGSNDKDDFFHRLLGMDRSN